MKSVVVMSLVIVFMLIGYLFNKWLQQVIGPRRSFARLFSYFLLVLTLVFVLSFLMVLVIGKLYPGELMK